MNRRRLTIEDAISRECALQLTDCGGPTASGLEGYICENCAEYLLTQIKEGIGLGSDPCSYCGSVPTYNTISQFCVCQSCAR
ncbi:MAG TPA: hypothetical protein VFA48_13120, partial [Gammaproteobacteria bacterium]|nr:hypothetical protein [Gammaproteobacteria bacterium]